MPKLRSTGERISLDLCPEDEAKIRLRGPGFKGIVHDRLTGQRYRILGANCGLPSCWCDVWAVPVDEYANS